MREKLPFLSAFLLERLGPVDEAMIGDLAEEYRSGRSRLWVWYQVFVALTLSLARTFRDRPRRVAGGLGLAWLAMGLWEYGFARLAQYSSSIVDLSGLPGFLLLAAGAGFSYLVVGALIGRVCRPFGAPIALAYFLSSVPLAVISTVYTVSGVPVEVRGWVIVWSLGQLCLAGVAVIVAAMVASGAPAAARSSPRVRCQPR